MLVDTFYDVKSLYRLDSVMKSACANFDDATEDKIPNGRTQRATVRAQRPPRFLVPIFVRQSLPVAHNARRLLWKYYRRFETEKYHDDKSARRC
jgi:hypothetical protein